MRVAIVRDDGVVGVDDVFRHVDLSALPFGVRAVQWNSVTGTGHIEYDEGPNTEITGNADFQYFIDLWTAAAPPIPPNPTPDELRAAAHARINVAYGVAVNGLTAGYPDTEIASWPKQETEARAYLLDNGADTPWLKSAAAGRGIDISTLVALIIQNADMLAPLHGALTGKRQKLRDQIDALGATPTQEQLDIIQW